MKIEALKTLIAQQGNQIIETLTFDGTENLEELIDFFKDNKLEIKEITLKFSKALSLFDRSFFVTKLPKILDHIKGLNVFQLEKPVKDYALNILLASLLQLEKLELVHGMVNEQDQPSMVNTSDFFETELVSYLTQNPNLKTLIIEDIHGKITDSKYSKLKSALIIHPKLTTFDQGMGSVFSKSTLQKNPDLISCLQKKCPEKPVAKKAALEVRFNVYTKAVLQLNLKENRITGYLNSLLAELKQLDQDYTDLNEGDETIPGKKAFINVLINYLTMVVLATLLQEKKALLSFHDRNTLEYFWDIKLSNLLTTIKINEDNDYSQLNQVIENEIKALNAINTPSVFPSSYKCLSNQFDDGLGQALSLLTDYTKWNSAISRFFHGHWNRHYVSEVNAIVDKILDEDIKTVDELLTALNKINITNPNGSLARRVQYIKENCQLSNRQDNCYMK